MNATDNPSTQDDRPVAVQRAEGGADAWRDVVNAQLSVSPAHADWYAVAGEVVETLRVLDSLAGVLARQILDYGAGRALYDDEGADPAHRMRCAVLALAETRHGLAEAERAANRFWSTIGHIGVEDMT